MDYRSIASNWRPRAGVHRWIGRQMKEWSKS